MDKGIGEFNKNSRHHDGLADWCRSCYSVYNHQRYLVHGGEIRASTAAYHTKHKGEVEYQHKRLAWRARNKEKLAAYWRTYHKRYRAEHDSEIKANAKVYAKAHRSQITAKKILRYHADLDHRLGEVLRARLRAAVKKEVKHGSAVRDLGCSIKGLKYWLEKHFEPGMSWENYGNGRGKWNIDHVRPLTTFNLRDSQQVKAACHFTNLEPMWANDNTSKGNHWVERDSASGFNVS